MADWDLWLDGYDRARSPLSRRLSIVQRLIDARLSRTAPRPVSALSICAGDGRDLLGVLGRRVDAGRVTSTLVELDPRLCARATERAAASRLAQVDIRQADAGLTDTYEGVSPADLVILVGVLGNIGEADMRATIAMLPGLCAAGALVVWSRRNEAPQIAGVREQLAAAGFAEAFASHDDAVFHVGAHRFLGATQPLPPGRRFFTFDVAGSAAAADGSAA